MHAKLQKELYKGLVTTKSLENVALSSVSSQERLFDKSPSKFDFVKQLVNKTESRNKLNKLIFNTVQDNSEYCNAVTNTNTRPITAKNPKHKQQVISIREKLRTAQTKSRNNEMHAKTSINNSVTADTTDYNGLKLREVAKMYCQHNSHEFFGVTGYSIPTVMQQQEPNIPKRKGTFVMYHKDYHEKPREYIYAIQKHAKDVPDPRKYSQIIKWSEKIRHCVRWHKSPNGR